MVALAEAVETLERRRSWLDARAQLGRSRLGDRAEVQALDAALPVLRERLAADGEPHSVRVAVPA